jgi:uncharacterized protein with PQ loop repeat
MSIRKPLIGRGTLGFQGEEMAEIVGWLGAILLAVCGAPQALKSIRDGHSRGISSSFLTLWLGGELCFLYSTVAKFGFVSWLLFNYVGNIIFVSVIIYFAWFPRERPGG